MDDGQWRYETVRSRRVASYQQARTRPAAIPCPRRTLSTRISRSCRIDRRELLRERLSRSDVGRSVIAGGPDHADTGTQDDDACEKEESLAFGGGWHGPKMAGWSPRSPIEMMRTVPFYVCYGYFARAFT